MNFQTKLFTRVFVILLALMNFSQIYSQQTLPDKIIYQNKSYPLYPKTVEALPEIPSPFKTPDGPELVVAATRNLGFGIIPVTIDLTEKELRADSADFPVLAKTGRHAEVELVQTRMITGRSIAEITDLGRPGGLSGDGFMAEDEDIISVLIGDNRLVQALGVTHPEMARPLLHIWNMMQTDLKLDRWNMARHRWENIEYVVYNTKTVLLEAHDTKGGQKSIFDDGIEGAFYIKIWRELEPAEEAFLNKKYGHLSAEKMRKMKKLLTQIETGEMEPMYIMRYGFYEGHTNWRTDPITISFIFGIKTLEEIENAFPGKLYEALTKHFTRQNILTGR